MKQRPTMNNDLIQTWRSIVVGYSKSWVAFEHGTCVILMEPQGDLALQATEMLAKWGPVRAGTPSGDFKVIKLEGYPGWVVTCHHPDILAYVAEEEGEPEPSELMIGLMGRAIRAQDAEELTVIHVEDKRDQ